MSLYFIHLDLRGEGSYAALHGYLATLGAIRITDTLWCARRSGSGAVVINKAIRQHLGPRDMVCTVEGQAWACHNTRATPAQATNGGTGRLE